MSAGRVDDSDAARLFEGGSEFVLQGPAGFELARLSAAPEADVCARMGCDRSEELLQFHLHGGAPEVRCREHFLGALHHRLAIQTFTERAELELETTRWFAEEIGAIVNDAHFAGMDPLEVARLLRIEYRRVVREGGGDVDEIDELLDAVIVPCGESARRFAELDEGQRDSSIEDGELDGGGRDE